VLKTIQMKMGSLGWENGDSLILPAILRDTVHTSWTHLIKKVEASVTK